MDTTDTVDTADLFRYPVVMTGQQFMRVEISEIYRWFARSGLTNDGWWFSSNFTSTDSSHTMLFRNGNDAVAFRLAFGL